MRLLLITISVLAASSTSAATGFLDKTPAEAYDDLSPWLESSLDQLFDDRVTLGDIIIYIIVGFVGLGIGSVVIKIIGTIRRQARQALNIRGLKTGIFIIVVVFIIILLIMFLM